MVQLQHISWWVSMGGGILFFLNREMGGVPGRHIWIIMGIN